MKATVIQTQLQNARARVAELEAKFAEARLSELQKVTMTKNGETITLKFGSRVIKAKKPARFNDRYNLTENGRRIATEVFGGIHDIRFAIALGEI
jgi:hypothetical protein